MEVDTLNYAIEGVLSIEFENRRQRLVAYLSKFLKKTKKNYKIYNKEILVVIRRLQNLNIYQRAQSSSLRSEQIIRIFHEDTKAELQTSLMDIISVKI